MVTMDIIVLDKRIIRKVPEEDNLVGMPRANTKNFDVSELCAWIIIMVRYGNPWSLIKRMISEGDMCTYFHKSHGSSSMMPCDFYYGDDRVNICCSVTRFDPSWENKRKGIERFFMKKCAQLKHMIWAVGDNMFRRHVKSRGRPIDTDQLEKVMTDEECAKMRFVFLVYYPEAESASVHKAFFDHKEMFPDEVEILLVCVEKDSGRSLPVTIRVVKDGSKDKLFLNDDDFHEITLGSNALFPWRYMAHANNGMKKYR